MPHLLTVPRDLHLVHHHVHMNVVSAWCERLAEAGMLKGHMVPKLLRFRWGQRMASDTKWQWLYFAKRECDGMLKVGLSSDPLKRIAGLRFGQFGGGFVPMGVVPWCNLQHERVILAVLDSYVADRGREWFRPCEEIAAFHECIIAARDPAEHDRHGEQFALAMNRFSRAMRVMANATQRAA